jgi:hypothetical protein
MTTLFSLRHFEQQFTQTFMPTALEQKPGRPDRQYNKLANLCQLNS